MHTTGWLETLRARGRITWVDRQHGWRALPEDVVQALCGDGFVEVKHEVTRRGGDRRPLGGLWQGLDARTGSVASAIWVHAGAEPAVVFIDIDGTPLEDPGGSSQ